MHQHKSEDNSRLQRRGLSMVIETKFTFLSDEGPSLKTLHLSSLPMQHTTFFLPLFLLAWLSRWYFYSARIHIPIASWQMPLEVLNCHCPCMSRVVTSMPSYTSNVWKFTNIELVTTLTYFPGISGIPAKYYNFVSMKKYSLPVLVTLWRQKWHPTLVNNSSAILAMKCSESCWSQHFVL